MKRLKFFTAILFLCATSFGAINKYWHVDSAGTGDRTEGTGWAAGNAINYDTLEAVLENTVAAGDVFFIKGDDTLVLAAALDCSALDGTATAPIALIGVLAATTNEGANVVYADWVINDANKPVFKTGANAITFGDHYLLKNLSFIGNPEYLVTTGTYHGSYNCKYNQNHGSAANQWALRVGSGHVIYSEITASNCRGLYGTGTVIVAYCNLHDIGNSAAIALNGLNDVIVNNDFNTCLIGVQYNAQRLCFTDKNTFYECAQTIVSSTGYSNVFINNTIEGANTGGIIWTTQSDNNFFWENHGNDTRNTDMWVNVDASTVFQDYEVTTGDPLFTNPAVDTFTLQPGSPCLNSGLEVK